MSHWNKDTRDLVQHIKVYQVRDEQPICESVIDELTYRKDVPKCKQNGMHLYSVTQIIDSKKNAISPAQM